MGLVKKFKLNPPDVLGALLSVDGENSQLDADMVDGKHYSDIINETQERIDDGVSAVSSALSGKANTDLSNVTNENFAAKAEAAGVGGEGQDLTGYATKEWVEGKGYLTAHQDITGKADTDLSNVSNEDFAAKAEAAGIAKESDVVHKSGNETITGQKTFDNSVYVKNRISFDPIGETVEVFVDGYKLGLYADGGVEVYSKILGVYDPTEDTDAANKRYVDNNTAKKDLSNVTNEGFAAKAEAAGLGGCKITTGTYEGSVSGSGAEKTLNFDFPPSLLVINTQKDAFSETNAYSAVLVRGNTKTYVNAESSLSSGSRLVTVTWEGNSVTLEGNSTTAMCQRDETYYYFAIGIGEE